MKAKTFCPSRRTVLRAAASAGGVALLVKAMDGVAEQKKGALQKRPKEKVGYRDEPYEGRSCAKCVLYVGHGEGPRALAVTGLARASIAAEGFPSRRASCP